MIISGISLILVLSKFGAVISVICPDGTDTKTYTGNVSITNGGRSCQKWSEQRPHNHNFGSDEFYPLDGSMEAAENFCRNVGHDFDPWCYTSDPSVRWQYCTGHICGAEEATCGGKHTTSPGEINFTLQPVEWLYDSFKDCLWKLEAPIDKVIELIVLFVDLKVESVCKTTFIQIYEPGFRHAHLCGNDSLPRVTSMSNILYIRFSCVCNDRGFHATYSHVDPPIGTEVVNPNCGGVHLASHGWIESPDRDGDGQYDIIDHCIWTIKAPETYSIDITIDWMEIEMSEYCEHDFLEIYDNLQTHGKFCGEAQQKTVTTFTNELTIRFLSDDEVTSKGFMLIFIHVPPKEKATIYVPGETDVTVPDSKISTSLSDTVTTTLDYKSASNVIHDSGFAINMCVGIIWYMFTIYLN